tara:strand:+ start:2566 stop:2958 length:393 start_codon:yes stop_codon:yes gene_type:complete
MKSVDQEGFEKAWKASEPYLQAALDKSGNEWTTDDVLKEVEDDHAIFYPVQNGAAIFRVARYPQKRMLRIWIAGGHMAPNINAVLEAAEFHADQHDCDGIEIGGRKGWERVLKKHGYQHKSVLLVKNIGE